MADGPIAIDLARRRGFKDAVKLALVKKAKGVLKQADPTPAQLTMAKAILIQREEIADRFLLDVATETNIDKDWEFTVAGQSAVDTAVTAVLAGQIKANS